MPLFRPVVDEAVRKKLGGTESERRDLATCTRVRSRDRRLSVVLCKQQGLRPMRRSSSLNRDTAARHELADNPRRGRLHWDHTPAARPALRVT